MPDDAYYMERIGGHKNVCGNEIRKHHTANNQDAMDQCERDTRCWGIIRSEHDGGQTWFKASTDLCWPGDDPKRFVALKKRRTEEGCLKDPFGDECNKYVRAMGNPEYRRKQYEEKYCTQGNRVLNDQRCKDWCQRERDACRPTLRRACPSHKDHPFCGCYLPTSFYAQRAADLAKAMGWPTNLIAAQPHCIHPPCATSPLPDTGQASCPDQVQQTCIQNLNFENSGSMYSLAGTKQMAQCILSHQSKKNPPKQTINGVPQTQSPTETLTTNTPEESGSDKLIAMLKENKSIVAVAAVVLLLLLLLEGDEE